MPKHFHGRFAPTVRNVKIRKIHKRKLQDLPVNVLPILSFDPGGTTGWSLLVLRKEYIPGTCVFDIERQQLKNSEAEGSHLNPYNTSARVSWDHGQIDCLRDENTGIHAMLKLIDMWPSAAIVVESFQLRQGKQAPKTMLSPERIGAVLDYELALRGRDIHWQSPAFAKTSAPDHRMQDWEIYESEGDLEHARDADRHVILMCRRCMGTDPKNRAFRHTAWPHVFNELGEMI